MFFCARLGARNVATHGSVLRSSGSELMSICRLNSGSEMRIVQSVGVLYVQNYVQCISEESPIYIYIYIYIERERERERERETDRQTDRQTETDREMDRDRQIDR